MKKLGIICVIAFVVILIIVIKNPPSIIVEDIEVTRPEKPKSVSDHAFWVGGVDGGNFIVVTKTKEKSLFFAEIYHDFTGELEYAGMLKYSGSKEIENFLGKASFYQGWDGENLHLANGESMTVHLVE